MIYASVFETKPTTITRDTVKTLHWQVDALEKINPKPSISLLNGKEELHQEQAASSTGSSIDRVSLRSTSNAVKTVPSLPDTVVVRPQDDSIPVIDASQGQTATNLDPETSQASDEPLAVIAPTHDGSLSSAKDEAITAIRDSSSAIEESLTSPLSPPLRESQGVALSISEVSESVELASVESPDRKSTRLNSSHVRTSRMPSSA